MINDEDDCSEVRDIDDCELGGNAYPALNSIPGHKGSERHYYQEDGMSMLDYFAGQALTGLATKSYNSITCMAEDAYQISQAMLIERAKRMAK